jgi:hypothetical protein
MIVSAGLFVRRTYRLESIKQNGQHEEEEGSSEREPSHPSQREKANPGERLHGSTPRWCSNRHAIRYASSTST